MNEAAYKIFDNMSNKDFRELFKGLLAHVVSHMGLYPWPGNSFPTGVTPEDIAIEIIEKTLKGDRNWDPSKIDLKTYLHGQVRSLVSHFWEEQKEKPGIYNLSEGIKNDFIAGSRMRLSEYNPETLMLHKSQESEKINIILEAVSDDSELSAMFEAIIEGCGTKPKDIAEWLGMDINEVYNINRRLARRENEIRQKLYKKGKDKA